MTTTTKAIGGVVIAVVALLGVVFFARSSSGSGSPPQISVTDAYASQTTSDRSSAMYMTIQNKGGSDHLVGVIAGGASTVTIHDAAMAPQTRLTVKGHSDTRARAGRRRTSCSRASPGRCSPAVRSVSGFCSSTRLLST